MRNILSVLQGIVSEPVKSLLFFRSQAFLLLLPDPLRRDFRQLVRARFPDEHGHFIIRWLTATLCDELINCLIPLRAPLAVLLQQFIGNATDFKTKIAATEIASCLDLVTAAANLVGKSVPVHLGKVGAALVHQASWRKMRRSTWSCTPPTALATTTLAMPF